MGITKKFRREIALVACVAVMIMNSVLPVYPIIYAMDDTVHDAVYYEKSDSGGSMGESVESDGETGSGGSEDGGAGNGDTPVGDTGNGDTEDGEIEDGEIEDGEIEDGEIEDGETEDGEIEDGETEDGETEDGEIEDGEIEDGEIEEEMETEEALLTLYDGAEVDTVWYTVYAGDQTFSIETEAELRGLAFLVNESNVLFAGKTIEFASNIELTEAVEWKPIGSSYVADGGFQGTLDGAGHTVSGLTINEAGQHKGLFGFVNGATIMNLTVSGAITQGGAGSFGFIGGIAGRSAGTTKIENCTSEVAITITSPSSAVNYIGGIVGAFAAGGTVKDCTNDADISIQGGSAVGRVGGILGYAGGQTTIDSCANEGDIVRTENNGTNIGGLVGEVSTSNSSLTMRDSHNANEVTSESTSTSNYTGGLVGNGGASLSITDSHNSGPVNSRSGYTGGLVGYAGNNPKITDSYNTGDVTITGSSNTSYIGGVAGSVGTTSATVVKLERVYNTGAVQVQSTGTGSNYTGGVAGFVAPGQAGSSITECHNIGNITGGNQTGGVFGSLGASLGNIKYCYNTGEVATNGQISAGIVQGGVAGSAGDNTYLSYCYNTGGITSTETSITAVGGITGRNGALGSYVSSGFNIGEITAANYTNVGGITGVNYAGNEKVYYVKSIVNDDIAVADANRAEGVEAAQVTNGWLPYMLDDGRKSYFRTTCWSQGDEYPIFADNGHKPVYKVTLTELEEGATIESDSGEYVKQDETATLTITPPAGKILALVTVRGARGKQSVNINDDGQSAVTVEFAMPGEDVTVTAAFVETPTDPEYTVTYHANDGFGNDATRQVAAGKRAESFDPDDLGFTNSGHTFEYWSLTDNGPEYDFNTAVVENIALYAIWRADGTWRVTFNLSGSIGDPPPPLFVGSGETVDKPSPDPIWESGDEVEMYVFDKWCKEDGEAWDFATDTVTEDITLYAEWKIGNIFAQSSEESPAVVGSEYALRYLSSLVNSGQLNESVYVSVYNDITLAGEWVPIGVDEQHVFTGSFDGGGYTISGVKVTGGRYAGLFGYAKDAVIKNITLEGSISTGASSSSAGGIAGYAEEVAFENCSNSASVSAISGNAGGISGYADEVTFDNCSNSASVSASGNVGGIAGGTSLKTPAQNLINTGGVRSTNTAGGIFGTLSGSNSVSKLYNIGNVESSIRAGGIIGSYGPTSTLEMCYNLGDISINPTSLSPYNAIGGIVGSKPESAKIVSCYSMGKITAKIAGSGADITQNVGGIVGADSVNIESCYFLKGDDGRTYSDEGSTRSVPLSADAFESGEAAWRLDKGAMASRTYNWSQDNGHPIFATNENKPVYRMSVKAAVDGNGKVGPEGVSYYRESSQVTLTIAPDQGYALASLAIADSTGRRYTANIKNNTAAFNMPAANITVTPEFMNAADIGEGPFTVSFHLNGGTGVVVDPQTVDGGEWAQQPSPDPTREGYIFAAWYDKAELDLVGWYNFLACEPFDFNTAIIKDMEFVACWLPRNAVVVSFDLNRGEDAEGSKPIPPQIVLYGEKIKRPADNPTWEIGSNLFEMVFNNWFDQASGGTAWDFETALSAEHGNALTLYAQWNKKLSDNPVIDNIDDLEELALNIKNGVAYEGYKGVKFQLLGNITLTSGWIGLGTSSYPFNGTLSGGNITLDPNQKQPFFGYLGEEGTVSGVTVTGTLNSTSGDFGGIAGTSEGTIRDCNVKLIIESPNSSVSNVGGIVGYASGGKIAGCTLLNGSIITGMQMVGGIVGNANGTEITGCETEDGTEVIGSSRKIGGIAGVLWYSVGDTSVTGCVNNANVGSGSEAGGIAGGAGNTESSVSLVSANIHSLTITDCVNNGEITGNRYLGGIVGRMGGGADRTIEACVNRGAVTAGSTVLAHVGGIIGHTYNIAPSINDGGYDVYENIDINLLGCENYGNITGNTPPSQVIQNIGGLIGLLAPGIKLTVTDCKVGGSVGANSGSAMLHTIGGLIGRVEIGQVGANAKRFATDVSVSDSSFNGTLNGELTTNTTTDANYGALGGVIGSITSSAPADGAPPRQVAIDSVRVDADMSGNSFRIGGVIGRLNGLDAKTAYTLTNISVEGDMPNTNTTAVTGGALGGIIGQMASFAGTLEVSGSYWKGNFTDSADLPHGGVIGDMGPIAATADVNITYVFMRGDFSGATDGGTGGIIGNITSLADGARVALENAYWYGAGIHPDNGKAGGIIGNIDENSGSLTVGNTYYGFSDGTEPAEESFTSYEGDALDNGITFKSKADFERGEVSYLLMEGVVTDEENMAAIASDGVTWEQDWKNKYPVFGEHRTHRITSTLLRQDSEGQLTPEPDASLVITAKSPGSPSETAYDDFGGSVEVGVVDIPEGYTFQSISIAGGSPESIGNNETFTLDGDAQVTAIIGEAPPVPPPPDEEEEEDPGTGNGSNGGRGKKGSGSGTGEGTGGDGYGLTPGGDPGLSGDTGALYPLPDGDTPAGSGETEGAENASSPAKDETLPESFVAAQQPENAEPPSSPSAAPPVEEQEPDETTESNVEGGADDEFAQGGPADESKNEPKAESDAMGALEAIEDVVKSNLPLIIAVAIVVAVITAVSGFLRYRKKRNSDDNIGM